MKLERVYTVTIDAPSAINFAADKLRQVEAELHRKYVGRCFMGACILRILRCLDVGACHVVSTNNSGDIYINVRFVAEVVVVSRWDILTGVRIVANAQLLVGEGVLRDAAGAVTASVAVSFAASGAAQKALESFAIGQHVPVRVLLVEHPPMQDRVSVFGTLLVCDRVAPAFRLRGSLGRDAGAELGPMLAAVEAELAARAALAASERRGELWFFEKLLYAYKDARPDAGGPPAPDAAADSWEGPPMLPALEAGAETASVVDIVRRVVGGESVTVTGVWCRSLAFHRSSPLVARARGGDPPASWEIIDSTPRVAFALFLKNILDFLAATRELVAVYNTRELVDSHINLWNVMRAAQKPFAGGAAAALGAAAARR
jgi:hypothetical protein